MAEEVKDTKKIKKNTINTIKPNIVLSIAVPTDKDKEGKVGENLYQMLLPARASLAESFAIADAFKEMIKVMIDDAVKKTQKEADEAKKAEELVNSDVK